MCYNYSGDTMNKKEFKTIDEQIESLRLKGLIINNEDVTKEILYRENYFFINGYRHPFLTANRKFIKGTTFEELYALFLFDRNFRNILFKNLLIIENNIKSIISYQLSKSYGYKEKDYLKASNFTQDIKEQRRVEDVLNKMKRQIRVNGNKHTATLHYITNYGYIPMWILVKVLSFGLINELYGILKNDDKQKICDFYKVKPDDMEVYLAILSNYRNLCAHEDIVYDHRTQREISNTIYHKKLNIELEDGLYKYGKNDIFALVIILKIMLTDRKFKEFMDEIDNEIEKLIINLKTISYTKIYEILGFPSNYKDIINM